MKKPQHIIWITADHLRVDHIGALGSICPHPGNRPVDRQRVAFDRCYVQAPLHGRASFMTGTAHQSGVIANGHDLDPDCPHTVARAMLRRATRRHRLVLHFQSHEDNDLDPRGRHDYGFDVFGAMKSLAVTMELIYAG